jgi:hypothetical protein
MAKSKRKRTEVEEVMELLNLYGAVEITEEDMKNNPKLRKSVEDDRERMDQHLKDMKTKKWNNDFCGVIKKSVIFDK